MIERQAPDGGTYIDILETALEPDAQTPMAAGRVVIYNKKGEGLKLKRFGLPGANILTEAEDADPDDAVLWSDIAVAGKIVGGSGEAYDTVQEALDGEASEAVEVAFVPASATAGTVTGDVTLSAVNDFYKGWLLVDTDTTPGRGLANKQAKVIAYDGTTKVITHDKPWNFTGESSMTLVKPSRVACGMDVDEDLTITASVELNMMGHRLGLEGATAKGKIDVTGGVYADIYNAKVRNGSFKTNIGVLKHRLGSVGRRDGTIFAVKMTEGSDVGNCILDSVELGGCVDGGRGYANWAVINCTNEGAAETDQNVPYRFAAAYTGRNVVVKDMSVRIRSEIGGAIFYSEGTGALTGATANISVEGEASLTKQRDRGLSAQGQQPCHFFTFWVNGASTLTITPTAGSVNGISWAANLHDSSPAVTDVYTSVGLVAACSFTGTLTIGGANLISRWNCAPTLLTEFFEVAIFGSSTCTGNITTAGTTTNFGFACIRVKLMVSFTGTLTLASNMGHQLGASVTIIQVLVTQSAGTILVTGGTTVGGNGGSGITCFSSNTGITTSGVTYTISGAISGVLVGSFSCNLALQFTSGTYTVSSVIILKMTNALTTTGVTLFSSSVATLTVTSATVRIYCDLYSAIQVLSNNDSGSTGRVDCSSAITIRAGRFSGSANVVRAGGGGSTGQCNFTGTIRYEYCVFEAAMNFTSVDTAGATVTGPSALSFYKCEWIGADFKFCSQTTPTGTLTWANASFTSVDTDWKDIYFVDKTPSPFLTMDFIGGFVEHVYYAGARPATRYRFYKVTLGASFGEPGLSPDVVDQVVYAYAAGTVNRGDLVQLKSDNTLITADGTREVLGVCIDTTTAGNCLVGQSGFGVIKTKNPSTIYGEMGQDPAAPSQQTDAGGSGVTIGHLKGDPNVNVLAYTLYYFKPRANQQTKFKTADETVVNNTLQDDDVLTFPVLATTWYRIKVLLFVTSAAAAAGIKAGLGGTATWSEAKLHVRIFNDTLSAFAKTGRATAVDGVVGDSVPTGDFTVQIEGTVKINAAGTLLLRWAQNATDAAGTTVQKDSVMQVERIG